jgi:hypothetical protein
MATLSIADRTRIWRGLMRKWSSERALCPFPKFDLYNPTANTGSVATTDDWIDAHGSNVSPDTIGYNGSLIVAMRSALSADMKTDLFLAVAAMRRGGDYIRRLLGEVD